MRFEAPPLRLLRARALLGALALFSAGTATAATTSVVLVGSVQQAEPFGCSGTDAACAGTRLAFDANDQAWQGEFTLKTAGTYTFRAAVTDDLSGVSVYGQGGALDGAEFTLTTVDANTAVKFYYDDGTHWVTTRRNSAIAVAPGSFQKALGCANDWDPSCLRSWLKDADGDGIYTFSTTALPAGSYEGKVAHDEGWNENYGADGAPGGGNIGFTVPADGSEVVFQYNLSTHKLGIEVAGAPKGDINRARAHWVAGDLLVWEPSTVVTPASFTLHHDFTGAMTLGSTGIAGGQSLSLTVEPLGLPPHLAQKFPHLVGKPVLRIAEADLFKVQDILEGQIALSAKDANGELLDATSAQLPGVLDELYANDEALGVTWMDGAPTLKLWAPTARNVTLLLFTSSDPAEAPVYQTPMAFDPRTGVWSHAGNSTWKGMYYLYEVTVYARSVNQVVRNSVTDPYSLSLSTNSQRSQLVDLMDPELAPVGWSSLEKPALEAPEDIVLYELHVRDFSINDPIVPEEKRGTFAAFTEPMSYGMTHLRRLAWSGLTHVHLLPVFDIATINEDRSQHQQPAGDLLSMAPDSEEQQAAVAAVRDLDGFNWGYDPYHYTVPEGSYSTNPDGTTRIVEFRQMVKALSDSGLRVVMDVVYNHTNSAGQNDKSVLDKVVPGYYHRLNADGNVETSTCCQNTATEHAMMEKLMVDSLVTWARAYKVDGFRFDLMGHHMKSNMLKAQEKLRALTLENDGVDGSKIYLYGEGWNFGEVVNGVRGENATQLNMPGTGIGTFSDRLRDAARGGGPFSGLQEQGFSSGLWYDPNGTDQGTSEDQRLQLLRFSDLIRVGLAGNLRDYSLVKMDGQVVTGAQVDYNGQPAGYTLDPQEVITYVSAHDNETLFDAIQLKAASTTDMDARVRMHNMALSLVTLGQGIPFIHAGDELLRSKSLDRNSYNSGDWFNKLDYTYQSNNWGVGLPPKDDNGFHWPVMKALLADPALKPEAPHIIRGADHLEEMLSIRKSVALFRLRTAEDIQAKVRFFNTGPSQIPGLIVMNLRDELAADGVTDVVVLFNANDEAQTFRIPEYAARGMSLHPSQMYSTDSLVATSAFDATTGDFVVPGRTTAVFINEAVVDQDGGVSDGGIPDGGWDSDAGTDVDAGMPVDAGTDMDAGMPVDAGTGIPVDAGTETDAGTTPETDAGTDPETDAGTDPETDAGTTPETDAGTNPETDAGTEPETDAGTNPETDAGTDPETDAGTDPETDAGTNPGTDAGVQPDAGSGNGNGGGNNGGGCGGCAGTGGEAFSALALLIGGVLRSRRRRQA